MIDKVKSTFRWKGAVNRAEELLLVIKTQRGKLMQIETTIKQHHTYQVPEIIGWPISWGHKPYLDWISGSISHN